MVRRIIVSSVVVLALASACGAPMGPQAGPAASMELVGDPLTGAVATDLNVTIRVQDAKAVAVPNQIVNFVVTKGGGHVFAGSTISSATGEAKEVWTLGTTAGEQVLEARAVDQATGLPVVLGSVKLDAKPGAEVVPASITGATNQTIFAKAGLKLSDLAAVVNGRDNYANPIAAGPLTFTASGLRLTADSVYADGIGSFTLTAHVGSVARAITVQSVEDMRANTWDMVTACKSGGGAAGLSDSLVFVGSTVKFIYPAPAAPLNRLALSFVVSGTMTAWKNNAITSAIAVRDSLVGTQTADSVAAKYRDNEWQVNFARMPAGAYASTAPCSSLYVPARPSTLTVKP